MTFTKSILFLSLGALLSACGGSDGNEQEREEAPVFSLAVSDAPVEDVSAVVVCFNTVELKSAGSADNDQTFTVGVDPQVIAENDLCKSENGDVIPETRGINLLDFEGSESEQLLSPVSIAAGEYAQMRLAVAEGSYAILKDTLEQISLRVPSNELKLDGFSAAVNSSLSYTIEFDLRKAMTNPVGQDNYILKPRGIRLVDNSLIGHVVGSVDETLLLESDTCEVAPSDTETSVAIVYLYEGVSLDTDTLADNGGSEGIEPFASTPVMFDGAQNYTFEVGFVPAGDYTLSLTCDTFDDPEADDDLSFISFNEVTITASEDPVNVNFE